MSVLTPFLDTLLLTGVLFSVSSELITITSSGLCFSFTFFISAAGAFVAAGALTSRATAVSTTSVTGFCKWTKSSVHPLGEIPKEPDSRLQNGKSPENFSLPSLAKRRDHSLSCQCLEALSYSFPLQVQKSSASLLLKEKENKITRTI